MIDLKVLESTIPKIYVSPSINSVNLLKTTDFTDEVRHIKHRNRLHKNQRLLKKNHKQQSFMQLQSKTSKDTKEMLTPVPHLTLYTTKTDTVLPSTSDSLNLSFTNSTLMYKENKEFSSFSMHPSELLVDSNNYSSIIIPNNLTTFTQRLEIETQSPIIPNEFCDNSHVINIFS